MAWSSAHAKLHILLRSRILLPKNSRILMAVSGGQDSLCMAHLLIELAEKWQWQLAVIHCNHRWRGDSADNAAHVLALAKAWQIPAWLEVAQSPPANEAAARKWRYESFAKVARQQDYDYVVTGHTQSDRAETVLYNLIRGTGTDGIGTLPWVRSLDTTCPPITLVRPLLSFSRTETSALCQQQQIPIWEDSTNQDLHFRRNRIRHELLPYLRSHFNPQVESALAQIADIATEESAYLSQQAEDIYRQCVLQVDNESWEIQRTVLGQSHLAIQRRVIRQLLQRAIAQPPKFLHIEKLVALLTAPNGSQSDPYPGGWIAQVHGSTIRFTQKTS
ncbi:MAG: tRNA lysidine(34) synthetase TilS [Phormidesmis sp.]